MDDTKASVGSRDDFKELVRDLMEISQDSDLRGFLKQGEEASVLVSGHDPVLGRKMMALVESARDLFSYTASRAESDAGPSKSDSGT